MRSATGCSFAPLILGPRPQLLQTLLPLSVPLHVSEAVRDVPLNALHFFRRARLLSTRVFVVQTSAADVLTVTSNVRARRGGDVEIEGLEESCVVFRLGWALFGSVSFDERAEVTDSLRELLGVIRRLTSVCCRSRSRLQMLLELQEVSCRYVVLFVSFQALAAIIQVDVEVSKLLEDLKVYWRVVLANKRTRPLRECVWYEVEERVLTNLSNGNSLRRISCKNSRD